MASITESLVRTRAFHRRVPRELIASLAWLLLIALAYAVGVYLVDRDASIRLFAPPLFGHFDVRVSAGIVTAVAVAAAAIVVGPRAAERLRWRTLLWVAVAGSATWALAIAITSGIDGITGPLLDSHDYLAALPQIAGPGSFLAGFSESIAKHPIHVQGHPPGMVLLLWLLDAMGLAGAAWASVLVVGVGVSSTAAVLIVWRELAGESSARRAAPFACITPLAIWLATSADALFAGVGAWAICSAVLACRREGRRRDALALTSGVLLGGLLFLSYGAVLVVAIVALVLGVIGGLRVSVLAGSAVATVAVAFYAAGFWWMDGLAATMERYEVGIASHRPYTYFLLANLAALAVATGPAVAAGAARIRWDLSMLPALAALGAVALADVSGLSKGEVERIWLPFAVWIVPLASLIRRGGRGWLAAQAAWTLLVQAIVRTPW